MTTPAVKFNPFTGELQLFGNNGGGGGGSGDNLSWQIQSLDVSSAQKGVGYFANSASPAPTGLIVTLPTTADVGDSFGVLNYNSNGFTILQNAGQSIKTSDGSSTVSSGSLVSTLLGDVVELTCSIANLEWTATKFETGIIIN